MGIIYIEPTETILKNGEFKAVIDSIEPDAKFCIKGIISSKKVVSWSKQGICEQLPDNENFNLQLNNDEVLLVLNKIKNLEA